MSPQEINDIWGHLIDFKNLEKSGDTILINLSRQAAAAGMAIGYPWRRAANRPRAENHRQAGNHRQDNKDNKENRDANHFREN